jgi:hypothetical protein
MYSQLTYTIAKQHQAELIQAADRARRAGDVRTRGRDSHPTTTCNRFRGRIASFVAQATPRTRGSF